MNFFGIKAPDGGFKGGARGFASILSACVVSVLISVTNFKASSCRSCFFFSQATANLWRWRQILLRIFDCGAWWWRQRLRSKGHNLPHQKRCLASFRVAGMALRAIPTCFTTCQKSFCVTGAILLHRFQKKTSMSRGKRSTLDVSTFILRGRQSTLGLSCCVFLQFALSRLRQVVVQIAWQARGFRKTRRKTSISYLQSDNCGFPSSTAARGAMLFSSFVQSCVAGTVQYVVVLQLATLDPALPTLITFHTFHH